ncbi:MAG: hypothetical protein ACOH1Q_10950 [Thiobacillus sp.]
MRYPTQEQTYIPRCLLIDPAAVQPYLIQGLGVNMTARACVGLCPMHGGAVVALMKSVDLAL